MQDSNGDRARILHILDAIEEIEFYNKDIDFERFCKTSIIRFASIKQMEIIGEAANHISEETRNSRPDIPWTKIIALRNILIHEYFGVDAKVLWDIIQANIPAFKKSVLDILKELDK